MDALQFFWTRYAARGGASAPGAAGQALGMAARWMDGLTEPQIRVAPHPGVNTIAWLLWHAARVEDVGVNRLVVDDRQVFDRGGWAPRLNVARRDFGTGMTPDEVHAMSARIDLDALRAYWEAVGRRTGEVVAGLRAEELDEVRDAAYLGRLFAQDGFLTEDALWVRDYMEGQTRGFFLCHLALTHNFVHNGEANAIRGLMGHPGR